MTLDEVARIAATDHPTWDQSHRTPVRPDGLRTADLLAAIDAFVEAEPVGGTLTPSGLRDLLLRWEMGRPE